MSHSLALAAAAAAFTSTPPDTALTRTQISTIMDAQASGPWTWRSAYDAIECAGAIRFAGDGADAARLGPDAFFGLAEQIQAWAPTQTVRTQSSQSRELFSTPPVLAAACALLLEASAEHFVLEPSAGNGGLAGPIAAFSKRLWLNEIDPTSLGLLQKAFPDATITARDASVIDALTFAGGQRFERCALNPPFRHADAHLRAAFSSLHPGGALVAILPARYRDPALIQRAVGPEGRIDVHLTLDASLFAHAGVSTATVLVRVVRAICDRPIHAASINTFADLRQLTVALLQDRPLAPTPVSALPARRPQPVSSAAPLRNRSSAASASSFRPPLPGRPVDFMLQEHPQIQPAGQSRIYAEYQASRIAIDSAHPHAGDLVESVSLASVPLPEPACRPVLPTRLVKTGLLSTAQLEAIVYAGMAHSRTIPGRYIPTADGRDLVCDEAGGQYRYGFFIGDGTGVGKGREIAGIIMDNLCQGRTRHLWVSESATLIEDARRDWTALGGRPGDIEDLKAVSANADLAGRDGIFFITYATLRRAATQRSRARLEQVLDLLGEDFDGVIVFDESHAMGNAVEEDAAIGKTTASLTGRAGLALQNALPDARVVYASATGASHVRNIAYASRLGLWGGPDTPFSSRTECLSNLSAGGSAALELLMRELKGRGLFISRSLSLAGVEYAPLDHAFSEDDISTWDTWSQAWSIIHTNLQSALESTGICKDGGTSQSRTAKAAALSAFESTKLRFFSHLLQSIIAPSLISAMEADTARGDAPIVQLTSTNQAVLDRRLRACEGAAADDLDFTPREYVVDYLERAFPTTRFEPVLDDDGNIADARPMRDEHGNPIVCPRAAAAKAALLESLFLMPERLGMLDQLMQHFGPQRLAECTGRSRRLLFEGGRKTVDARGSNANSHEASRFMGGSADALVFSAAGGTGRSYHACRTVQNQRRRIHYLAEPGWRADKAVQGLGRSHRTNQASSPCFRVPSTDLAGQKRFVSTISQRLETLGAFTKADRRSAGEQLFSALDNLEGDLPMQAYRSWCYLLKDGKAAISLEDFQKRTGLQIVSSEGQVLADNVKITRWLNRLLALPVAVQNGIFAEFFSLLEAAIDAAAGSGTLDREIESLQADKIVLKERHELPPDAEGFLPAYVSVFEATSVPKPVNFASLPVGGEVAGRFRCNATGKPVLAAFPRLAASVDGTPYELVTCYTPTSVYHCSSASLHRFGRYQEVDREDAFKMLWAEVSARPVEKSVELVYVLHGACLHLWRSLSSSGVRVRRIASDGGETIIGRLLEPAQAHQLAEIRTRASLDTIVTSIVSSGLAGLSCSDGTRLSKTHHMNRPFLQVHGFERARADFYRKLGAELIIHNYSPKLLVPWDQVRSFISSLQRSVPGLAFQA